ncbi:STAS domain-containing protein [Piscibacillus sp. B03]|uniref:STAS domain-containing protein n=1 Tax=Piscibacillus sp. B03 TaxID=3457430 RepID=UPI003FCDAC7B
MEKNEHLNQAGSLIYEHYPEILNTVAASLDNEDTKRGLDHLLHIIEGRVFNGDRSLTYQGVKNAGYEKGKHDSACFQELVELFPYISEGIWNYISNINDDYVLTMDERLRLNKEVELTILHYNAGYTNGYASKVDNENNNFNQKLNELSVPIIKVDNNIGVCPLIGDIDSDRASVLMSKTLNNVSEEHIDYLILDLTGMGHVNELVAKYLFDIVNSMELIGTNIIFTGIHKQLAMTAISLNINLGDKKIYQTVADALKSINKST